MDLRQFLSSCLHSCTHRPCQGRDTGRPCTRPYLTPLTLTVSMKFNTGNSTKTARTMALDTNIGNDDYCKPE